MNRLNDVIATAASDPRTAGAVAAATTSTGLGTFLEYIPDDIGKLATLIGIILSTVLIRNHWHKGIADRREQSLRSKKIQLEVNALHAKEVDRDEAARLRREAGRPTRREED